MNTSKKNLDVYFDWTVSLIVLTGGTAQRKNQQHIV